MSVFQVLGRALTDLDSLHVSHKFIVEKDWSQPLTDQELDVEPLSCEGGLPWRDGELLLTFLKEVFLSFFFAWSLIFGGQG